jgi:uncharacterized protein (DUF1778 family)
MYGATFPDSANMCLRWYIGETKTQPAGNAAGQLDTHPPLQPGSVATLSHLARENAVADIAGNTPRILLSYRRQERVPMTTLVLSVRVNEEELALLEAASALARTSLSDFIRRKAIDAAEADVLDRRIVSIPAKDWEAFEAWANRAPEEIANLRELARRIPA